MLLQNSFISLEDDLFSPTQLGRAAIASSLPPEASLAIFEDLNSASRAIAVDTELHMLYLVTPINVTVWQECDWHHLFSLFSKLPSDHRRVAKMVGASEKFILEQLQGKRNQKALQVHIRFFSALALFDLINEMSIYQVSNKYRIPRGCLQTLQSQSATYAAMIVAFCLRLGWTYLKALLDGFAMRLLFGIRSDLSELVTIEGIDGQRARILHERGITCLSHLSACESSKLAHFITLAVPYSRSNSNDGLGEWLFGEPRMKLADAARVLKERARKALMRRIQELGIAVELPKEEGVKKEENIPESYDSGLPDSCPENDGFEEMTRSVTEMSISDDDYFKEEKLEVEEKGGDVFEEEVVEDTMIEDLETSLLKMKPPKDEIFLRRLSNTFSPAGKRCSLNGSSFLEDSFDKPVPGSIPLTFKTPKRDLEGPKTSTPQFEDSFDKPVPGSIPLGSSKRKSLLNSSRRDSIESNASENKSFDVFATPPTRNSKIIGKHSRAMDLAESPLCSPIVKHPKIAPLLRVEDIFSSQNSWSRWMKSSVKSSFCSISLAGSEGIVIQTDTGIAFIPLQEQFNGIESPNPKFFDPLSTCHVPLKSRLDCLKIFFESQHVVHVLTMNNAFRLFEEYKIKLSNVRVLRVAAHLNHLIESEIEDNGEMFPMLLDRIPPLLDPEIQYSTFGRIHKSMVEVFEMQRIFNELKKSAIKRFTSEKSFDLEMDTCQAVLKMFYSGISFDHVACKQFIGDTRKRIEILEEQIWRLAHGKFNINSSNEASNVLFHRLGLVYPETSSCKIKQRHLPTNKQILDQMIGQHQIVEKILTYRHIQHTLTQCLLPLANYEERIHCRMEMCTATGRMLTSSPNLQNVPKKVSSDGLSARQLFKASPGNILIGADYKQLELRVLAHLCNDSKLVKIISEDQDLFGQLSSEWGFSRDVVKQLSYGLIYGMGAKTLAELTRIKLEEAEKMLVSFFAMFPGVRSYINAVKDKIAKEEPIETIMGRKKFIKLKVTGEEKARMERVAVNYTVQGSASEIFKTAMVEIQEKIRAHNEVEIVLTIHDEVLVECPEHQKSEISTMKFCIRNFICEHSQEIPGPMDNYFNYKKGRIPVFHIYGVTDSGQKACLHIHGVLPYLVLRAGGKVTPIVLQGMRAKINKGIEKEIETSTGKASKFSADYVYKLETFSSRSLYGYQDEEEEFVKVYFSSPFYLQKATHSLGKEVIDKPLFQPFEAHLPFHLQFFIDNSIFGMDNIHLKNVKFRVDPNDNNNDVVYQNLTVGDVKNNDSLLSPYERKTTCHVECDAMVSDILNLQMQADNVHSSNPGLEYIWREEKERCDAEGIELKDTFNSYEPRKSTIWPQEREMLRTARKMAKRFREERCMSEQLDDLMTTRIAETQQSSTSSVSDMTIWEKEEEEREDVPKKKKMTREKTPEELDEERQKEEDREEVPEDDDNDPGTQEAEMTMITDSQKVLEKDGEEDVVMEVDEEEEDPDKTITEDVSSGEEESHDEVIQWITTKSSYEQSFISMNEELCEPKKPDTEGRQFSREMTACSVMTDETVVAPAEHSQAMEQSKLLSQISQDEQDPHERSGESDIVGLCVASLELLVDTKRPMPNFVFDPIVSISLAIYNDVCRNSSPKLHIILTTIPNGLSTFNHKGMYCETESEMLEQVMKLVIQYDVDVLVGYETVRLSWGYFMRRYKALGSDLSMDRTKPDKFEGQKQQEEEEVIGVAAPKGRLLVSVWKVVRSDLKLRNYDLGSAVTNVLRRKIPMIDNATLMRRIRTNRSSIRNDVYSYLLKLATVNITLLIEMNWFLKNAEMARVYGIQFHEVWTRGSQLRVESMLLRLAHRMNFVAPSVTHLQRNMMGSPEQLQLILEPQSKVYFDPVIVLDFQSLYPSMVIAYNYCYSTILGKIANLNAMSNESKNREEIILGAIKYHPSKNDLVKLVAYKEVCASPLAAMFVKKSKREGVLPLLLREILSARIMVKNAIKRTKSKKLKRILDARQLALKLVANVSYGYTAANWSGRMPCAELADAILGKGRETLERAIEMVQRGDYGGSEVIYGDTDSLFVLVRGASVEEAFEIGRRIADDVTNSNPDPVVLKLEKVYKGCVLETKKRYAGWMYEHENDEGSLDAKGIETVRRDTCPIVSEVLEKSLGLIFSQNWKTLITYLNTMVLSLQNENFSKFVFCKEYRGDYSQRAMVPQKKLAEARLRNCSSHITLRGERVPYVIIDGVSGSTVYSCVRSIESFARNPEYKINTYYYLNAHILAALRRVTDLIPMKIDFLPLAADQCFVTECSRIGKTPWCIECETNPEELALALVQSGREGRARTQIRQICTSCQSSTTRVNDEQILECMNFSCLLRQTMSIMERARTDSIVQAHTLF
ncbi:hypothetical protein L5515_003507 [Caenorhabditis briggsae]|uniref:DNA polymerase zeta catalytic subunit n=2 Tax=Caenorhabditis briggsae TaxID=6238 RepID=A0AAE9EMA0_CAEBR|nr:hypothetical protein L5515_003507 [Caenorhabditis briggsae]